MVSTGTFTGKFTNYIGQREFECSSLALQIITAPFLCLNQRKENIAFPIENILFFDD